MTSPEDKSAEGQPPSGVASVLLVDDNESSLVALQALLEPLEQRLVVAGSGEEALKLLLHEEFAVVLMDVKLPGIDGYETASLMRGIARTRMTPIIFLTGVFREPAEVLRGYDKGAVDYLIKPYDPDILRSKVAVFVELYRTREQVRGYMREEAARTVAEADRARLIEKANEYRLFQTVLTQMPEGVLVVKAPAGEPLLSNRRLDEILGAPGATGFTDAAAVMLRPDGSVFPHDDHPIARTLRTREQVENEIILYPRGTAVLRLSLSAAPVFNEADALVAVVGTVVDITERHEAERERERLIAALKQSNDALDKFASMASHDLKAPLRGLSNLASWIEESLGASAGEEVAKYLGLMKSRVAQMAALMDGILKYARAGQFDGREEVPVVGLLAEIVDLLQTGPACVIEVAPDLPALHVEKIPLQQVLLNLIGNALKYSHRDDVRVKVGGGREGEAFHFTVEDNGPGIPEEFQGRIWEMFQTLEPRSGSDGQGSGIGLAVVKKIVESRGGRTWVESSQARTGCVFHVVWPC